MSEIRGIYHPVDGKAREPNFPATDQHPDAKRYVLGLYVVDAIGEPTQAELDAALNPQVKKSLTDGSLADLLVKQGVLTQAQVDTASAAVPIVP